ncbi:MAG: hypothetical protein J7K40_11510 [candidate division Zixibacteria bacterium]|nr:hypothetical protein [candidate division Zixibacteria bacterium]
MGKASITQLRMLADRIAFEEPGKEFKIDRTPLTDDEMKMLMKEINRMMILTQSTIHRKMLTYHIGYIVFAAEAAKKYFEPKTFGGRYAADTQFGIDSIRPEMVGLNQTGLYATGTIPVPDWGLSYTTAPTAANDGFVEWICGDSASKNYRVKEDSLILVTALDNLTQELYGTPPLATAVKPNMLNGEEKPVLTLRPMLVGDLPAMVLPSPWMFIPKTDVRIEKQIRGVGKDCLAMYGMAFGTGSYLKNKAQLDVTA